MLSSLSRSSARRVVARSFSAAAATDASAHKPPLDIYGIHARYANATYTAASKAGTLDRVEKELQGLKASAETSVAFKHFLENPLISRDSKVQQITSMLKSKSSVTTLNLMTTLAGNARLMELPKISDSFSALMKAKRGQVEATITSAEELTKAQTDSITKAMKAQIGEGKQVMLTTKVDPSIIGGLQVQIGDQFLDLSVSSKIDAISRLPV
eukprot:CAMPEP_0202451488 /NCGR_PEP_ID=MMETSP1360-20130828/9909_1 /ASSEMBLY_ACC=CAM_ASM_000848 /TAXON_ID=515479 /ORGANISM="Licmophora paradoxa, Strain CCMP2313" /LENGTH=211 /DNA_ID=CAMNT_0049070071 /DNA_START=118 /DNA_END=753 /DNA_ORIENTATION=+